MTESAAQRVFEFLLSGDAASPDCVGTQDALHRYVDLGLAGRRMDVLMPAVALHLQACAECRDEYDTLVALARMEAAGSPPTLPELWSTFSGHGAAQAIARATRPSRVVPVPVPGRPQPPAARPARWPGLRRRLGRLATGSIWVPALAAVAVCSLAFGWWQVSQAPRVDDGLMGTLRAASQIRFAQAADGAWARVFYGPDGVTAAVALGGLPEPRPGQRIECWLKEADGSARRVAVFHRNAPSSDWWLLNAQRPFQHFAALALTLQDDGRERPLVEVPLLASR